MIAGCSFLARKLSYEDDRNYKSLPGKESIIFFFFQAEDGIRDVAVTGVQTCALPISRTPEGREVVGSSWLWIPSSDAGGWGGQSREIRMVADKKSYKVGETARVVVMTGMPETYLMVTTEARTIQSKRVVHATSPSATIEIPIRR